MTPQRRLAYTLPQLVLSILAIVLMLSSDWQSATLMWTGLSWSLSREVAAWERIAKGRQR